MAAGSVRISRSIPLIPSPMSEVSPCLNCGACCSHFRVSFFWGECSSSGGTVPDELVTQISPSRVAMNGTDCSSAGCTAAAGDVGGDVNCCIYELHPRAGGEREAPWGDGEHNGDWDKARVRFG